MTHFLHKVHKIIATYCKKTITSLFTLCFHFSMFYYPHVLYSLTNWIALNILAWNQKSRWKYNIAGKIKDKIYEKIIYKLQKILFKLVDPWNIESYHLNHIFYSMISQQMHKISFPFGTSPEVYVWPIIKQRKGEKLIYRIIYLQQ